MRKILKFKTTVMLLVAVCSLNVFGEAKTYILVTSTNQLEANAKYLIVGGVYAMGLQNSNNRASVSVTISNNSITVEPATVSTDTKPFEITLGGSSGLWTLLDAVNNQYLRPRAGDNNGLQGNSTSQNWSISVATSGVATIVCENTTTYPRNILRFNSSSSPKIFACYGSGQADVYLYKLAAPACTASNLAFSQPTVNKIVTDAAFTQAATSANATTAITYASTVEGVATVNENTGEITIVGAGSTTITATQAAGTHNAVSYCASTATYTLNVVSTAPTITVTEVTVPAFSAYATETDSEIIQVSGANLTESIGLQLTGDNANLFSLSTNSVTSTANNVAVTVYYNPTSAGSHTATLTLTSAGATSVVRTLNGSSTWKPLTTPVATGASNITNAGFTANWDAVMGATEYEVNISKSNSSTVAATDLFISEYSEGTSNNKYIEIYNGTGASVDLSVYTLKQSKDGAGWNTDANASSNLPLTGTLANNDVYVVANGSANATILAQADKAIAYNNTVQGGTLPSFNGNDAIGLFKNDVLIDVFGDVTSNVNFAVAGTSGAALDHTIVRKSSITVGNVNWAASAGTTVENSEWVVNALDSWTTVGAHSFASSGSVDTPIAGSPFTVTGNNSKTVSGLEAGATYKYTVTAKNANLTSAVSNVISVTTSTGTGVTPVKDRAKVYSVNGQLIVESHVATTVDIYNAVGQLIDTEQAHAGKNTFTVAAKGIVFVKSNNTTAKVIL